MNKKILVTGAGGFIGHHLVNYLKERDYWVRGVDIKEPEYSSSSANEFPIIELNSIGLVSKGLNPNSGSMGPDH